MKNTLMILLFALVLLAACNREAGMADAYGNFEAVEVILSSESTGRILSFGASEGMFVKQGGILAEIDSAQLVLKREQLASGRASLDAQMRTLEAQIRASRVQLAHLQREMGRVENMLAGGAATDKQRDDLAGQIEVLMAQIAASESGKSTLATEKHTLEIQIRQVEDQIRRCRVTSPLSGTLLVKYREAGELVVPGQALCKVANMDQLMLRAYISGNQLSSVQTGDTVRVHYDGPGGMEETTGFVSWISPRAEFTPKIIQTREERVDLVYAMKVRVENTGNLKIGMPGEVVF